MITEIEDFFSKGCGRCARFASPECSVRLWAAGLQDLRGICLDLGLLETVKWAHPCYMHAGRNIALITAFRHDFRLSFINSALLSDPEGVLERNGPNTLHPGILRFREDGEVRAMEPIIRAYLMEAMHHAGAGTKAPKEAAHLALPQELVDALDADPELSEAFHRLTPGRQKSYVIDLAKAKQTATRVARIAKFRDRILAGKGAMER